MDRVAVGLGAALALALGAGGCFRGAEVVTGGATMTGGFTTTGGETTTTTTATTTGGEATTTTGAEGSTGEPAIVDAFRVVSAAIVDPHTYYKLSPDAACFDITDIVNAGLAGSLADGDVNIIMTFAPADPELPAVDFRVIEGKCNGGLDTCAPADGVVVATSTASNAAAGLCNILLPGTYNPDYADEGAPNVPSAPCFTSSAATVAIDLSGSLPPLELIDAQVAATYALAGDGDVDGLIKGTLRGYLTQSKGEAVVGEIEGYPFVLWGTVAGGGGCQPDPDLPIDDTDPNPDPDGAEAGVWVYLNFEAARVEWLE